VRIFLLYILLFSTLLSFGQKQELQNRAIGNRNLTVNKSVSIELNGGSLIKGELVKVDEINKIVIVKNASDSTEIKFNDIYKVHDSDKNRELDYMYRIDVPERFFYTPMGNTMPEGMVSLENTFIINNTLKAGLTDRIEAGIGFSIYTNDYEDSYVSGLLMISFKYKYIDR